MAAAALLTTLAATLPGARPQALAMVLMGGGALAWLACARRPAATARTS